MKRGTSEPLSAACPCGRGGSYLQCCGRWHRDNGLDDPAPDAETLMRSRYSAYVMGLTDYLRATWHVSTRPADLNLQDSPSVRWLGLEVKAHHIDADDRARVEFVARCKQGGRAARMHEISRFVKEDGRWFYVDGEVD